MTGKHTPGLWYAVGSMVEVADDSIPDICSVDHTLFRQGQLPRPVDETLANARLIAAAPDLLEVAYAELNAVEQDIQWAAASELEALMKRRDRLEAAIARATGEQ